MGIRIGVIRESGSGEKRVALTPEVAKKLQQKGATIVLQSGAGLLAGFADSAYPDAEVLDSAEAVAGACQVLLHVLPPTVAQIDALAEGAVTLGYLQPHRDPERIERLRDHKITAFGLEVLPRTTRAQAMDVLSSQASVAGYKAVLIAAELCAKFFPMLTTAAGTVKPASVLVLGVGVAGLQALATAKRLGARTTGYDVRPEVADQVRSVGAQWLDLGIDAAGEGGYARELSTEERAQQQKQLEKAITGFDVVITTALVPGRPAPRLVTAEAVEGMRPGSVVVDLAGETGGNCELTEPGATVVRHGVTIASPLNLPATMPEHASELYAKNLTALLELLITDGELAPDFTDEVVAGACVTREEN